MRPIWKQLYCSIPSLFCSGSCFILFFVALCFQFILNQDKMVVGNVAVEETGPFQLEHEPTDTSRHSVVSGGEFIITQRIQLHMDAIKAVFFLYLRPQTYQSLLVNHNTNTTRKQHNQAIFVELPARQVLQVAKPYPRQAHSLVISMKPGAELRLLAKMRRMICIKIDVFRTVHPYGGNKACSVTE